MRANALARRNIKAARRNGFPPARRNHYSYCPGEIAFADRPDGTLMFTCHPPHFFNADADINHTIYINAVVALWVHYRTAPSPSLPPRPLSLFPPPPDMAARAPTRLTHLALAHPCVSRSGAQALGLPGGGFIASPSPAAPSTRGACYATASAIKGGGAGGNERDVEAKRGVEPAR
jgi:hypothetical protein